MKENLSFLLPGIVSEKDYQSVRLFYGRDLGGKAFFDWKHFQDVDCGQVPKKQIYRYQQQQRIKGIVISTCYTFYYNQQQRRAIVIGDLGIEDTLKSTNIVKQLVLSGHQQPSDIIICHSDHRKIAIYKKIFEKCTDTNNLIIPFLDVVIESQATAACYQAVAPQHFAEVSFHNNLGRRKDNHYFNYLQQHPLYTCFHFIRNKDFYCVIGMREEYAEIVELSSTSNEIYHWAIAATLNFHARCKILVPQARLEYLIKKSSKLISQKDLNLLISSYPNQALDFDPDHLWISRLERR